MLRIFVLGDSDVASAIRARDAREVIVVDDLAARAPDIEVLVAGFPPREGWASARRLRLIQLMGVGADMLLPSPDLPVEVEVAGLRGVFAREAAEHAIALVLALCRALPEIRDRQNARVWRQFPNESVSGKTLGIIGMGSIGTRIARTAEALGMVVTGLRSDHTRPNLEALLSSSHYLVVAAPLTPETVNMIAERELALLPAGARVINIARAGIINEEALVLALQSGQLGGAALDVAVREPLTIDDPLWSVPNLLITPHVAGFGLDYIDRMIDVLLDNVSRLEKSEPRRFLVNREKGY